MKHIRKFETTAGFEAEKTILAVPNVSLVTQTNTINYLPEPDWVEINGVKWATKNLGAATMFDTGLYYQWGDTQGYTLEQVGNANAEGKKYFGLNDYKYYNGSDYAKYNEEDGNLALDPEDDAVTANWGSNWRIPTIAEAQSLIDACNYRRVTNEQIGGPQSPIVSGYIFTDKTDSSKTLFFPELYTIHNGSYVQSNFIWTSQLFGGSSDSGAHFDEKVKAGTFSLTNGTGNGLPLYYGLTIRPVYNDSNL